ncbi:hypothetical protein GCM10009718_20540 [Isoptericola halotolerans]|uniref:Uncharacterized membrane protein (DUF485 family) n=1 Tax=Isoptericola halotolerans TaxID=300560 RepID=A0ABX2A817_9MICO|nr:DUF4282 domain-containing protein [Isoptericola halotolerans]NOV99012.1 uncharacterized membrane protein (DUF485 family) [Isoptericola halotolerans]
MSENTPTPPGQPGDPYGQQPPQQPPGRPQQPYQQPEQPYQQPIGERPVGEEPFYAGAASSAADVARNDTKGFFGALFDYSFTNYVTPKVVKIIYIIVTILIAFWWLIALIASFVTLFSDQWYLGLIGILFGWIVALVYLALWRIGLEFVQAIVSISEKVNLYARRDGIM